MGFSRRFETGLAWRTLLLIATIALLVVAWLTPGIRAGVIVAMCAVGATLASLWQFVQRTNFQLSRFIESVRFEDYSQRLGDPSGAGFDVLGDTLDHALKTLRDRRIEATSESRYLSAVVDDAPSALVAIDEEGRVNLLNKAARGLFGQCAITRLADFDALGPEFAAAARLPAGSRKISRMVIDDVAHRVIVATSRLARLDRDITLLSVLPVQSELGALEVSTQADLVRVLTHEIMNSLTPVTSLARTGADLVKAAQGSDDLEEARAATDAVARRAEGLLRFVESYREFARTPSVRRQQFAATPWAEDLVKLARSSAGDRAIDARLAVEPPSLEIDGDPELLAQAVLNLLRNAVRATTDLASPVVRLSIRRVVDGQFRIEVADNGPGIPADQRDDVFLPFFTTHAAGSGVGLSFARQVALAHGGSISVGAAAEGGASLTMVV